MGLKLEFATPIHQPIEQELADQEQNFSPTNGLALVFATSDRTEDARVNTGG